MQMKGAELAPQLAEALKGNSTCSDLNLTGCNLDDGMVEPLAARIAMASAVHATQARSRTTDTQAA